MVITPASRGEASFAQDELGRAIAGDGLFCRPPSRYVTFRAAEAALAGASGRREDAPWR
jgi:hypothetical protein